MSEAVQQQVPPPAIVKPAYKLSPCPAEERVCKWYDVPQEYAVGGVKGGSEGEQVGEDGIIYQKCGGGRRIVRKKIGN